MANQMETSGSPIHVPPQNADSEHKATIDARYVLNLAGIERVLELERRAEAAERRVRELEAECAAKDARAREEIDRVRRAGRAELVRVVQTPADLVPMYRPIVTRKGTR